MSKTCYHDFQECPCDAVIPPTHGHCKLCKIRIDYAKPVEPGLYQNPSWFKVKTINPHSVVLESSNAAGIITLQVGDMVTFTIPVLTVDR